MEKKKRNIAVQRLYITAIMMALIINVACTKDNEEVSVDDGPGIVLPIISGYPIVETNQSIFYNNQVEISVPEQGSAFYGQDASYNGNLPAYVIGEGGIIADMVTGLMWQRSPDTDGNGVINAADKMTYTEAVAGASSFSLGGYDDWRLPTIKEQYSLILFSGVDPSGYEGSDTDVLIPFIDTQYFDFGYGDTDAGERIIDAQYATSTKYVSTTMNGDETMFGVNFADGRIKGYGLYMPFGPEEKTFYVTYVRGNTNYGANLFQDNSDGTISDLATELMWMQNDSEEGMNWESALSYAENFEFAGQSDWRLPNAKELQSIVDYTRSPATTSSAAIDPIFNVSSISNEAGELDFPCYWSSTTHSNWSADHSGANAAYISFGRAMGYMNSWMDVHGAGAQRSDPKVGSPDDYPTGHGPQGDAIRIFNHVRLVRDI